MQSNLKTHLKYTVLIGVIIVPFFFFGVNKNKNVTFETINWDGETITYDDFQTFDIDLNSCDTIISYTSEEIKWPFNLKYVNDSLAMILSLHDFYRVKIVNLNNGDILSMCPAVTENGLSELSTVGNVVVTDSIIWLIDRRDYKILTVKNDYTHLFPAIKLYNINREFNRIVPQRNGDLVYLPSFDINMHIAALDPEGKTSAISKQYPPVKKKRKLTNYDVQANMEVSPDLNYFVVATLGWDFIEIYNNGNIKMIRGPFFNETAEIKQKGIESRVTFKDQTITFTSLRVGNDKFAVAVTKDVSEPKDPRVIYEIENILIFSKEGIPLYKIKLPVKASEFDIDYDKEELILLQNYDDTRILRFKIDFPEV